MKPTAHASGVALMLAGVAYASWVLGGWLNPRGDIRDGYLSELSAATQAHHVFFAAADIVAGLLVVLAVLITVLSPSAPGSAALRRLKPLPLALGWLFLGMFGAATVADAALPMDCAPYRDTTCALLERSNHLSVSHQMHAITSSLAVIGAIAGMLALTVAVPRLRPAGIVLAIIEIGAAVTSLPAMFGGQWLGVIQRVQVATVSVWLVAVGAAIVRYRAPASQRRAALIRAGPGRQIATDRTLVHVVSDGTGSPAVLLEPGLGGAWFDWDLLVPLLTGQHRVIRMDRPGPDASPHAAGAMTLRREADRLAALITVLDLAKPIVVAHSLGALYAEAFARWYPTRIGGLVLVDPSCEPDARQRGPVRRRLAAWAQAAAPALGAVAGVTGLARVFGPPLRAKAMRVMTRSVTAPGAPEDVGAVYGDGRMAASVLTGLIAYRDLAADLLRLRAEQPFPDVPVVVLTALGDVDGDGAARHAALACQLGGRQVVLPNARHMLHIDHPDTVAAAVESLQVVR